MAQNNRQVAVCKHALAVCRLNKAAMLPHIYELVDAQLCWLITFFEGHSQDREKLRQLTFGHYAAREIDPRETELISALNKAFYLAYQESESASS